MRFGRTLQLHTYASWREQYIDYAKLKKLLREDDSTPNSPSTETKDVWTEEDEGTFVDELVNVQLEKVHAFHRDTYDKLRERTAKCEARLDDIAVAGRRDQGRDDAGQPSSANGDGSTSAGRGNGEELQEADRQILNEVLAELDKISKETSELEKYSRINYTGFLKAVKKHDRKRGNLYRVRPLLQVRLAALPFNKEDYGPLIYRLSAMYSFVRQHLDGTENQNVGAAESQQGKEEYISHKFWVHPENLLEVKTIIMRRLPVLVYNPQTSKIAEGNHPDPSITSIYFDSPAFDLYTNKVDQGEASSLRLRWYGQLNAKPEIHVEKKTVKEDSVSHESRFTMKEKYVQRFIKGEDRLEKQIKKLEARAGTDNDEVKAFKSSVDEIQSFVLDRDLQPVLRANYTRTAFQIPGDDRVRISLDTELSFIREDALDPERPCRDPETWHRTDIDLKELEFPFTAIRKGEISRFPFALLEIKIRNDVVRRGEWIQDIMNSHLVKEAPRFSKFVHGVAQLFEDYVNTFPFWLPELETDIRRDPQQAFEEEQAKKQQEIADESAVGSLLKSIPSMSPMHRGHQGAIMSPIGSPSLPSLGIYHTISPSLQGKRKGSNLAPPTETTEEVDDDGTGLQAHDTQRRAAPNGLRSILPTLSSSKYARARRTKLPPGVSKPAYWIKDQGPVRVEAKVWLANQRTFIKWQHVSVLLATLSVGLYNAAGADNTVARTLAVVYTAVAVFAGAWGYGVYMWRSHLIERRSGKDFDAVTGPVVVCLGLIVALVLNFAFKYTAVLQDRERRGDVHPTLNQSENLMWASEL